VQLDRVASFSTTALAFDLETHVVQPGLLVPPVVCGSAAWLEPGPTIAGALLAKQDALEAFANAIEDPNVVIVGANIAYDLACCVVELARLGVDAIPQVFGALEDGRVFDVQIAEALNAIACGHLGKDPRTMQPIVTPGTKKRGRYSLSTCVLHVLGRSDAKANDEWRLRYAELEHVPIADWPTAARDYPIDDAKNTLEVGLAQTGQLPKVYSKHSFVDVEGPENQITSACQNCGSTRHAIECVGRGPHANLVDHARQVHTAFCLHLGAMWGFHVDQDAVDIIERHAIRDRDNGVTPFREAGIVREDGSEDQSLLKKLVLLAYAPDSAPCPCCAGTGRIPSPTQKPLRCPACRGRCQPWKGGGKIKEPTVEYCATCATEQCPTGSGKVPHPRPELIGCVLPEKVKTCDGTGYALTESVPKTNTGGVGKGRSVLHESGDEFLMRLGDYKKNAKVLRVYVPYLRGVLIEDDEHGDGAAVAPVEEPEEASDAE
jgi:hypothetical protein